MEVRAARGGAAAGGLLQRQSRLDARRARHAGRLARRAPPHRRARRHARARARAPRRSTARPARAVRDAELWVVGAHAADYASGARRAGVTARVFDGKPALAAALRAGAGPGVVALLKASRGVALEEVAGRTWGRRADVLRVDLSSPRPARARVPERLPLHHASARAYAAVTALLLCFLLGPLMIAWLRARQARPEDPRRGPAGAPEQGRHADHGRPAHRRRRSSCRRCCGGTSTRARCGSRCSPRCGWARSASSTTTCGW